VAVTFRGRVVHSGKSGDEKDWYSGEVKEAKDKGGMKVSTSTLNDRTPNDSTPCGVEDEKEEKEEKGN